MASTIHSLAVKLAVRDREFHSKMNRAKGTVAGVNKSLAAMAGPAAIAAAAVIVLAKAWQTASRAGRMLWNELEKQRKLIDDLAKDAKKLNVLPGTLKELRLQAGLFAGVEAAQLDKAMARMRVVLRDVAFGSGAQAAAALADLGISIEDIQNLDAAEQFRRIQAAMARMGNTATTAGHANQIFGRASKDLMPFLTAMPGEIDKSTASMSQLFDAMDRANFQDMEDFNDRITRMKEAFQVSKTLLVDQLSPALSVAAEDWERFDWSQFGMQTDALTHSLEEMVVILGGIPDRVLLITRVFEDFVTKWQFVIEANKAFAAGDFTKAAQQATAARAINVQANFDRNLAQTEINDMQRRIQIENRRAERQRQRSGFDPAAGRGFGGLGFQIDLAKIVAKAERQRQEDRRWAEGAKNQRQEMIEAIKGSGGRTVTTISDLRR